MDIPKSAHLVEINYPSITESIDELFNNITAMMSDYALMYGGAVNSILADLPIKGDLDIAISNDEFMEVAQRLANSTMWLQVEGSHISENNYSGGGLKWSPSVRSAEKPRKNSDYDGKNMPMSKVAAFETVNGSRVHIIESKHRTGDPLEDALFVIRAVDLKCCGVGLDRFGRLLEAVEGGFDDCMNRTLRLNMTSRQLNAGRTKGRIIKYVRRGWGLGISIDQAMANINKANKEAMKKRPKGKYRPRPRNNPGWRVSAGWKGHEIRVSMKLLRAANGNLSEVRHAIQYISERHYSLTLIMDDSTLPDKNYVRFCPDGKKASSNCLTDIMKRATYRLEKTYGSAFIDAINAGKPKKKKLKFKYGGKYPSDGSSPGYSSHSYPPVHKTKSFSAGMIDSAPTPEEMPEEATDDIPVLVQADPPPGGLTYMQQIQMVEEAIQHIEDDIEPDDGANDWAEGPGSDEAINDSQSEPEEEN